MLAFPSNHYKDKIGSRKSTPKLSAYVKKKYNIVIYGFNNVDSIKYYGKC